MIFPNWTVESDTRPEVTYEVVRRDDYWTCTCPQGVHEGVCKHIERKAREVEG